MKTLETERLTLRAWQMDDLEDFYGYAKNPNVGPHAGWQPHRDLEESRRLLETFIEADETWSIVPKETGRASGSLGLHPDPFRNGVNSRHLGYVLAQECWGKGYATEAVRAAMDFAFRELELEVLAVRHYPHNTRSRRVIEKCGFVYEGTTRRAARLYDGTLLDCMDYSLLREEYLK